MRRISQNYVIGTSTKLDLKGFKFPKNLNDDYFNRERKKRAKKEEGDIFSTKKETYKASEQRKADQKIVDKQVGNSNSLFFVETPCYIFIYDLVFEVI